ncbi:hypothetical protein DPEC_G00076920 [Dallia pectoralis]|uniref:Uncharacterized protein n=1 Tax=Dallia pectoralis TaxID=75939 RepID=A0ACC2H3S0_DALPE|nr:hypothetical protein DPEC_G00076920 [Dallia pectoralis]
MRTRAARQPYYIPPVTTSGCHNIEGQKDSGTVSATNTSAEDIECDWNGSWEPESLIIRKTGREQLTNH